MDPVTIDPESISVYGSQSTYWVVAGACWTSRKMQQLARALNDSIYIGIGKVYEALVMGMAADLGETFPIGRRPTPPMRPGIRLRSSRSTPTFSPSSIPPYHLPRGGAGASEPGPAAGQRRADLCRPRRGNGRLAAVYTQVAHSLKARYYMHLAEVDPANYAMALAEVPLGSTRRPTTCTGTTMLSPNGQKCGGSSWPPEETSRPGAAMIEILKRRIAAGVENEERLQLLLQSVRPTGPGHQPISTAIRPGGSTGLEDCPRNRQRKRLSRLEPGSVLHFNFINANTDPGDCPEPVDHLCREPS